MKREIVLDTETTGLDKESDRIVEIGCVELINRRQTGETFHIYCNPQRRVRKDAQAIHGLSDDFLRGFPTFAKQANSFLIFIGDAPLVMHNASFDLGFLNAELDRIGRELLPEERAIDSLYLASQKHPGMPNSLDALCKRYHIDASAREKHGALTDAELLAKVYIDLVEKRQASLALIRSVETVVPIDVGVRSTPLPSRLTEEDIAAHRAFVASEIENPVWDEYWQQDEMQEAA